MAERNGLDKIVPKRRNKGGTKPGVTGKDLGLSIAYILINVYRLYFRDGITPFPLLKKLHRNY